MSIFIFSSTSSNASKILSSLEISLGFTPKHACTISTPVENEPRFRKIDRRYRASSTSKRKSLRNRTLDSPCYFVFSFFHSVCNKKKKKRRDFWSASLNGIFFNGCERDRDNEEKGRNIWFTGGVFTLW